MFSREFCFVFMDLSNVFDKIKKEEEFTVPKKIRRGRAKYECVRWQFFQDKNV